MASNGAMAAEVYVQAETLPPQLLPSPPAEGSAVWKQQIAQVLQAQKHLSVSEIDAMRNEQRVRVEMMTSVLGASFTRANLPETFAFLDHVLGDAEQISSQDKKFFHTRRPYLTDVHVRLYVDAIDSSPAYPSGHTTDTRVLAEVLALLLPEKADIVSARADAIAWHRVEAGVHYPVDLEAGRSLAMLIMGAMLANQDFQDDLTAAKNEISGK